MSAPETNDVLKRAIAEVSEGRVLTDRQMESVMEIILDGHASAVQLAAFSIALKVRGETKDELVGAVRALRRRVAPVALSGGGPLFDTCGTGGDGVGTFNISTATGFVVAGCGVRVAKHGNRAVSSRSGSADVLEALGVRIDIPIERLPRALTDIGFAFLFAPSHHQALRHAAPVRKELGVRTMFNLLGPLANPAFATHQLVGVYDPDRVVQLAEVMADLGVLSAWVVHGDGGLDEISPSGPTSVAIAKNGKVTTRTLTPRDFGIDPFPLERVSGGDSHENADLILRLLKGETGAARDVVLMNAAAALVIQGTKETLPDAMALAAHSIDSGAAMRVLDRYRAYSHQEDEAEP